jgi:D-glycero-alpha-D-manno-heptose-7-phosphate kinase
LNPIMAGPRPIRVIHAQAPIRINDIGAWTDTWFAGRGKVLNAAVLPGVEVQVEVTPRRSRERARVAIHAENYGETFRLDPDRPSPEPHGLLQFAVGSLAPEPDWALDIRLHSSVPAGISTGTSAAVCVALLGALNALCSAPLGWAELARLAHRVETEKLGQQSGIQDQIAAAHGGISYIEMSSYPDARVSAVRVGPAVRSELDRRLCLVYMGAPHRSTDMHEKVIAELEAGGPQRGVLERLTEVAGSAREALRAGDLEAYGAAMIRNHECQRALYAGLISAEADAVASVARRYGAPGWKVNGAGGRGGSLTVLAPADDGRRRRMIAAIAALARGIRVLPSSLSTQGVQAWESFAKES